MVRIVDGVGSKGYMDIEVNACECVEESLCLYVHVSIYPRTPRASEFAAGLMVILITHTLRQKRLAYGGSSVPLPDPQDPTDG